MMYPAKNIAIHITGLILILAVVTSASIAQTDISRARGSNNPTITNMTVEQALDRLAYSYHGFSLVEPQVLSAFEVLKRNPTETIALIKQRSLPAQFIEWLSPDKNAEGQRIKSPLSIMIVTLGKLQHDDANNLLGQWYIALQRQRKDYANNNEVLDEILRHQFLILHHLHGRYVDAVANSIIERLPGMDKNERQLSLIYLVASAKGETQTINRLKQLAAKNKDLAEDSFMQQTLDVLTGN